MKRKVILIGGGHGLSNIVKGFKNENIDLSIIVASTDDGGHTGKIRKEFKTIAVGDLRMVLNELIDDKSSLKDIFDYRFNSLHGVNKVSLGNLMITSLWMKYNDIDKVIRYFKDKENIKSNIFLSSNNPLTLCAKCDDGEIRLVITPPTGISQHTVNTNIILISSIIVLTITAVGICLIKKNKIQKINKK